MEPAIEAVEPRADARAAFAVARQLRRHSQRKKCRHGSRTHRRNITQPARQALVSHRFRRMPAASEMHILDREVGSHDELFTAAHSQHGRVIANADAQPAFGSACRTRAHSLQDVPFQLAHRLSLRRGCVAPASATAHRYRPRSSSRNTPCILQLNRKAAPPTYPHKQQEAGNGISAITCLSCF